MAITAKQDAFATACAKGENASEAYRAAYDCRRMSRKTINEAACRLLANGKVAARIAEFRAPAVKAARLEIEETLRQLACVLRSDARRLFRQDGSLIRCTSSTTPPLRPSRASSWMGGRPRRFGLWSKTEAIDKAMRHLGLYEQDNRQQARFLAIQVNLV